MKQVFAVFCLFSTVSIQALAIDNHYADRFNFSHVGVENGLSNAFVVSAVADNHGAVWVATETGVNRISGNGCLTFNKLTSPLLNNGQSDIYYDQSLDAIWVSSSNMKIELIDCRTLAIREFPDTTLYRNCRITCTAQATDGGTWIGYRDGVIVHRSTEGQNTVYTRNEIPGLPAQMIRYILDDKHGHVYIGYNLGGFNVIDLERHSVKVFHQISGDPTSLPGENVRAVAIDQWQNVWVATNHGLAIFDPVKGKFTLCNKANGFQDELSGDNVMDLCLLNDGTLWVTSEPGGITVLDLNDFAEGNVSSITMQQLLPSNCPLASPYPHHLIQDPFGNVWIQHFGVGVDIAQSSTNAFHILTDPASNGKPSPLLYCYGLTTDSHQDVWIGGDNTLYRCHNDQVVEQWDIRPFLNRASAKVFLTYCDSQDRIWMGIDDEGVLVFDSRSRKFQSVPLAHGHIDIRSFFEDSRHQIWIGTELGVYLYDGKVATSLPDIVPKKLNHVIYDFCEDCFGRIWVATGGNGIFLYNQQHQLLDKIDKSRGLCDNNIDQILRDANGGFWIATRQGLAFIRDASHLDSIQNFGYDQGLIDDNIRAVCQDALGQIWVSTQTTISCWNPLKHQFSNYDFHEGIPNGGFIEGSQCHTSNGTIYFGSSNGICYFNPRLITNEQKVTPVQINQIEADDNYYRISFTVANYAQRDVVEYQYRMKGLDDQWHHTLGDRNVTFRNLSPGKYTFQVMARLRNGDWDGQSLAETSFRVAPPFWLSWWALLFYALIIIAIICIIAYYYLRKVKLEANLKAEEHERLEMEHLNDERLRFYTNITHELRTPLTLILGPLEDLVNDKGLAENYHHRIQAIHSSALRLLGLINQILEFRKTETQNRKLEVCYGDLRKVVSEVGLRYEELNRNRQVKYEILVPDTLPDLYFDTDVITTILNNLLSNAMKYTDRGFIRLSLQQVKQEGIDYAQIQVSDSGYGIPADALPHIFDRYYQADSQHQASGSGIGLAIVRSLATLHQGTIEVESRQGEGTIFTFRIIMDNSYPDALHKEQEEKPAGVIGNEVKIDAVAQDKADERPMLLIVEDNDEIRQYILESFDLDYRVITARNGKEGLDAAFSQIPDIIVSDIMMPVMDGIALCKAVKYDVRTSHIPVILLTAKDTLEDKETGYDSGADSYLTKPFSAKLLRSRIQNLLNSRHHLADILMGKTQPTPAVIESPTEEATTLSPLDRKFLDKLNLLIAENLNNDGLDIAFLTDRMNMSSSTLYRKVKGLTTLSPNGYVRLQRLQRAKELLREGKHTVTDIAFLTGFSTPNYFRDCFKAEFGISPSEYRQ